MIYLIVLVVGIIILIILVKRKYIKSIFLKIFNFFETKIDFFEDKSEIKKQTNKNNDNKSVIDIQDCFFANSAFKIGKADDLKFKRNKSLGYDRVLEVKEAGKADISENITEKI